MARLFNDASSQYLGISSTPIVTTTPFSIAAWFRSDDIANLQCIASVNDVAASNHQHCLWIDGAVGGDPISAGTRAGASFFTAVSTTGYSANTWGHACGVWASVSDRRAFFNGANKGTNNGNLAPNTLDSFDIGRFGDSTPSAYFSGRIAEVGLWNIALSDNEVFALGTGLCPLFVRPQNLVGYWPLWGLHSPEIDLTSGAHSLTVTGATVVEDHAPMMLPSLWRPTVPSFAAGGGGGSSLAVLSNYYRRLRAD